MTADKVALAQHVENDEIKLEALQVRASRTDGSSTRGLICVCFWQIRNKELEIEVMNLKDDNQQVEVRNQHLAMPPSLLRPREVALRFCVAQVDLQKMEDEYLALQRQLNGGGLGGTPGGISGGRY